MRTKKREGEIIWTFLRDEIVELKASHHLIDRQEGEEVEYVVCCETGRTLMENELKIRPKFALYIPRESCTYKNPYNKQ